MRVTRISWCKVASQGSTEPETGAAEDGSGVQESGIWPSPASRPEVGVQTDPSRAGQIDFAPGMQVGEILFRPARAVERLLVGRELNEVAGDKPRRQSEMAE